MPNSLGQNFLSDFISELQVMGFGAFSQQELTTYINRGYYHVARKNRWYWEQATDPFTVAPGAYSVTLWPTSGGELPYFRSLDKCYLTSPSNYAGKLDPMDDDEFFENWLSQDLTLQAIRGTPSKYYIWNQQIYILSPPASSMNFIAHYHRRVAPMSAMTDVPLTPPHLDEAILIAAKMRCHKRAIELNLEAQERVDLDEVFDDMRDDDAELMDEQLTRVSPDDTWY